jgi:hypothetical protein
MPRRPPGVDKRGSTWSVVIDHRDPATGVRRKVWHSGYATMAEAAEARTRLLRERDTGRAVPASHLTVGQYLLEVWLPERKPAPGDGARGHRGRLGVQTWHLVTAPTHRRTALPPAAMPAPQPSAPDYFYRRPSFRRSRGRVREGESNPHARRHQDLNLTRPLPARAV